MFNCTGCGTPTDEAPASRSNLMKTAPKKSLQDKHAIQVLVRDHGPISRVGIYDYTKIRRSTISQLTRELLKEGKLVEVGLSDNPLGRKQVLLKLNPAFGILVGIEFDDETMTTGVMDLEPRVLQLVSEPTDLSSGQAGLIAQLIRNVRGVLETVDVPLSLLIGIGVADPGLVDTRRGYTVSCSTINFWKDIPLQSLLEAEFGVPTLVESKTRVKTIAERMLGSGDKQTNMIYLDYGTGIGAGVVVDGRLLYGQNCGAGEIGHTSLGKAGPTCQCGSNGCLEATIGAVAVETRVRRAMAEGVASQVLAASGGDPERITAWLVFAAAQAGDKLCSNIVSEVAEDLGIAIANLVNLFNPSIVCLDRRLQAAGEELLLLVSRTVKAKALAMSTQSLSIRFAQLGQDAGLLGVALQVLERHYAQGPMAAASRHFSPAEPAMHRTAVRSGTHAAVAQG